MPCPSQDNLTPHDRASLYQSASRNLDRGAHFLPLANGSCPSGLYYDR